MDPITNLTSDRRRRRDQGDADPGDRLPEEPAASPALFTSLTAGGSALEQTRGGHLLADGHLAAAAHGRESASERNRVLYVLKSRGMAHSNQMREFLLTDDGIDLVDVYAGPGEVLTGAARLVQEAQDEAEAVVEQQAAERRQRELEPGGAAGLEAQIAALAVRARKRDRGRSSGAFRRRSRPPGSRPARRPPDPGRDAARPT